MKAFCFVKGKLHLESVTGGKEMFKGIRADIDAVKQRDPAARSALEVLLLYSGVHALIFHRLAHRLFKCKLFFLARLVSQLGRFFTGIEIHPGAQIGRGVFIDHGMGVVIGETAIVGDNCTIYQGVTLGGTGKDKGKRHPTLEDNVLVGSGAKVLGPFTVHSGSKIAANAVVLSEIPEDCTVVGIPGRIVKRKSKRTCTDMDQIHIPDPVAQELCKMQIKINALESRVKELEGDLGYESI